MSARGAATFRLRLPAPPGATLAWHRRPGALERSLAPWWEPRVLGRGAVGQPAVVTFAAGRQRWRLEPAREPDGALQAVPLRGPLARLEIAGRCRAEGGGCVLEERFEWRARAGPLAAWATRGLPRELERWLAWRAALVAADLARAPGPGARPLAVGITGASGFLGGALSRYLESRGERVVRLVRGRAAGAGEVAWDPAAERLEPDSLAGLDAIVHLAGAGIAEARWSAARRRVLVESRVRSTALLARALAAARGGPRVLVSASAVGWYGDRGEEPLDESSPPGTGFLAGLAQRWEEAAAPAARAGVRVAHPRIGVVLWPGQGALAPLARAFRLGAGGPLGSGRAWWSWVGLHDLLDMIVTAIVDERLAGPFNAVAPEPARGAALARALGRALGRPSWAPAPAFALRLLLGRGRADEMLLASQRVHPRVLERTGFRFRDPALAPLLERLHGRPRLEPEP